MKRKLVVLGITLGVLSTGVLLICLIDQGLRIPCLFHNITGLLCPGCGNTRATMALLRLDFRAMLRYNLTYPIQILYVLRLYWVCAGNYIRGGRFAYHTKPDWVDIVCLSLILIWTILRNCIPLL